MTILAATEGSGGPKNPLLVISDSFLPFSLPPIFLPFSAFLSSLSLSFFFLSRGLSFAQTKKQMETAQYMKQAQREGTVLTEFQRVLSGVLPTPRPL